MQKKTNRNFESVGFSSMWNIPEIDIDEINSENNSGNFVNFFPGELFHLKSEHIVF